VKLEPKNGDSYYYRRVRQKLGKADAAKEDFKKAIEVGTNFAREAAAAMAGKSAAAAPTPAAARRTDRGRSRGEGAVRETAPPGREARRRAGDARLAVQQRAAREELRQQLLEAYGGRCAITGGDGEAAPRSPSSAAPTAADRRRSPMACCCAATSGRYLT
jgi:hypothetical protein